MSWVIDTALDIDLGYVTVAELFDAIREERQRMMAVTTVRVWICDNCGERVEAENVVHVSSGPERVLAPATEPPEDWATVSMIGAKIDPVVAHLCGKDCRTDWLRKHGWIA